MCFYIWVVQKLQFLPTKGKKKGSSIESQIIGRGDTTFSFRRILTYSIVTISSIGIKTFLISDGTSAVSTTSSCSSLEASVFERFTTNLREEQNCFYLLREEFQK